MKTHEVVRDRLDAPYDIPLRGEHLLLNANTQYALNRTSGVALADEGLTLVDLDTLVCEKVRGDEMAVVVGRGDTLHQAQRNALAALVSQHGHKGTQSDRMGTADDGSVVMMRIVTQRLYIGLYTMSVEMDEVDRFVVKLAAYVSR